jgi:hypothetical protein
MGQAAGPIAGSIAGSAISSQGSKKAAKGAQPQLPAALQGLIGDASSLIRSRISGGFPRFAGPFVAPITPGQGELIGAGTQGLQSALSTTRGIAETGLSPEQLALVTKSFEPLFQKQRQDVVGGVREAEAQGGRFFSRGAVNQEREALTDLSAKQTADIIPLALQATGLQLAAANSLPSFLQGGVQAIDLPRQVEQKRLEADFAEFLRTQPENALGLLSSILGGSGAPFFVPPAPTNFAQSFGANLQQLFSSGGFLNTLLQGRQGNIPAPGDPDFIGPVQP